jgi:hypothetical protein
MRRGGGWGRATAALAGVAGALLLPGSSSGLDGIPPGYSAPPLTAAQLTELGQVKAWRVTYRRTWTRVGSWSGRLTGETQSSSTSRTESETVQASFVVSSASGGPDYSPDPSKPASVSIASSSVVTENYALQSCAYVDGNWTPGIRSYTQEQTLNANLTPVGVGAVSDGSAFALGFFTLPAWVEHRAELSANPPRAGLFLRVDTPPGSGTQTNTTGGCLGNSSTTSPLTGGILIQVNFRPEATPFDPVGSSGLTADTQVRVENGRFVIRGSVASEVSALQCVVSRFPFCQSYYPPELFGTVTTSVSGSWEAVPLCGPIPEDKLTDPKVADGLKDGDGDGIPDCWEEKGIQIEKADGSVITYDLPGADPKHKDIYLEVDYMAGHAPVSGSVEDVVHAFANAPVANAHGGPGITLHAPLDEADAVPAVPTLQLDPPLPGDLNDLADIKSTTPSSGTHCGAGFFGTPGERDDPDCVLKLLAKRLVYRYALFANRQPNNANGKANSSSGVGEFPGNDFMVTLGGWRPDSISAAGGQRAAEAATFMHELGHTLGLAHGGGDDANCKPNYLSVMNYTFQFPYANRDPNRPLDYSRLALPGLNEASLDEPNGIGGPAGRLAVWGQGGLLWTDPANAPIDWNASGASTDLGVSANINRIDTIGDCEGPKSLTIDGRYLRDTNFEDYLDISKVPDLSAFVLTVNGAVRPLAGRPRLFRNWLYLTLATPVAPGDTVSYSYTRPAQAQQQLTLENGDVETSYNDTATNISGQRQSLSGYDDWSNLLYSFRGTPGFADGQGEVAHPNVPDLTSEEVLATAQPADTTAPASSLSAAPPANPAGWNNTNVTISLSAADETGGSGVREIDYSATGAQPLALTKANGSSVQLTISAEGSTTLSYFAVDNAGNTESPKTITVKIDKTPPTVTAPSLSVDGESPLGAQVTSYPGLSATDNLEGSPTLVCLPAAPHLFSVSPPDTTVQCTATDAAGNQAAATFTVHVRGAAEQLAALRAAVDSAHPPLGPGLANHLGNTLREAATALKEPKRRDVCHKLDEFTQQLFEQVGGRNAKLTIDQARAFAQAANRIETVLGCLTTTSPIPEAEQRLLAIIARVDVAVIDGQARIDLEKLLSDAGKQLAEGDTKSACKKLGSFVEKTSQEAGRPNHRLDPGTAAAWSAQIRQIKTALDC